MGVYAITGSASGIGAATRARLTAAGHDVIGVDRADQEVNADLATSDGRAAVVAAVTKRCNGQLDGLVTAAGVGPPFDPAEMVSINYFGTEAILTGLRSVLAAANGAQVVALCSNSVTITPNVPTDIVDGCVNGDEAAARHAAQVNGIGAYAYAASKIGIARYVRTHAPGEDWAGSNIRLNAIAPGATMTPLTQSGLDSDEVGEAMRSLPIPTGEFAQPDQIAGWIEHMLTGVGASFMCGSIVFVDGGSDALIRPDAIPPLFELDL